MERFVKGEVVVVPFPFSDLTQAKRRPALVITEFGRRRCNSVSDNQSMD